jgi:hypothetical protein
MNVNINSILTEWRYRLPAGYPKTAKDFGVLRDVILEMTDIDLSEAESIVRRAMGLNEAPATGDSISVMYTNRVFRVQHGNEVTLYVQQPFDMHDFNPTKAAQGIIPSKEIDINQFDELIQPNSGYDIYTFSLNTDGIAELGKQSQTVGKNLIRKHQNDDAFLNAAEFESYIKSKFSVEGQEIIGLAGMYNAIIDSPETDQLIQLITGPSQMRLETGVVPIRGIYLTLYRIIKHTIKIPNGDESELWFAIAYGGLVKGAVAGESGIEADIEVGDQTISLKNYEKTTFDFGSLPTEGVQLLNSFLEMAKLLTGQDINKTKGRIDINRVLDFLDNEKTESDIRHIIELGQNSDIELLKNISIKLRSFYTLSDNLDTMIHAFCNIVDKMVSHKIRSVGWWGMIIKSNETLFLESSAEVEPLLMCRNDRLSPAIANFHQNKLFVIGSQLNTKVTKKSQD